LPIQCYSAEPPLQKQFQVQAGTLRFLFEGARIRAEQTPMEVEMEDGDQVSFVITSAWTSF